MSVTWSTTAKNSNVTLSNGNLTATGDNASFIIETGRSDTTFTDKRYWECTWVTVDTNSGNDGIGVGNTSTDTTSGKYLGVDNNSMGYFDDGGIQLGPGAYFTHLTAPVNGDVIRVACDGTAKKIWFSLNGGSWNNSGTDDPATGAGGFDISFITGALCPAYCVCFTSVHSSTTANFGATTLAYSVPSGFSALDGGGVNLSLAATETTDTASFTSSLIALALSATESADTAAFAASLVDLLALSATEAPDTAAFAASIAALALAASESPDTAAFTASLAALTLDLALAAGEAPDTAGFDLMAWINAAADGSPWSPMSGDSVTWTNIPPSSVNWTDG